jgi:hypothetical protein
VITQTPAAGARVKTEWKKLLPGMVISLIALVVIFNLIDPRQLVEAFRLADYRFVGISILFSLGWLAVRGQVWRTLLQEKASYRTVFLTLNEGYLLNNILPFRLGEVGRALLLSRKSSLGFWEIVPTIVIERALDIGFAAGIFLSALPFAVGAAWASNIAILMGLAVLVGLVLLYAFARRRQQVAAWIERLSQRLPFLQRLAQSPAAPVQAEADQTAPVQAASDQTAPALADATQVAPTLADATQVAPTLVALAPIPAFLSGLGILADGRLFLKAVAWMVLNWSIAYLQIQLLLRAFFPEAQLHWGFFVLGSFALGIAAPSTPGALGVFELVLVGAISVFINDPSRATAFALVNHLFNYAFTGLIGAYALSKEGQSLSSLFSSLYQRARGKA